MRLINLSGAASVQHPVHGAAEVGPDGVFDVSPDLGAALVKQRGQWVTEAADKANKAAAELLELADPKKIPKVLAQLRARIVDLEATVTELRAAKPAQKAAAPKK